MKKKNVCDVVDWVKVVEEATFIWRNVMKQK